MLDVPALASECRFAHRSDLDVVVAARLWEIIDAAVEQRGRVSMVLSGGTTPAPVYNVLREMPLPWDEMTLCPSDERWVDVDDPASNEGMFRRELLGSGAAGVELISMARNSDDPDRDATACNRLLEKRSQPWDIAILGMGTDGHTASWFPGAPGLPEALNSERRCAVVRPAGDGPIRLTLTRTELLSARLIILLISGERKWQVYDRAKRGVSDDLPVSYLLHQDRVPVDVFWSVA